MRNIKEKKERALGIKLFVKAERCHSPKCVMVRRPFRPGAHGKRRHTVSDFGKQLQEKQKIQLTYGLNNRQTRLLFSKHKADGVMRILERRLDRAVFLLGFAMSSRISRQMVSHGHIQVNGRKMTIPSYQVRIGDVISVKPKSKDLQIFSGLGERFKKQEEPAGFELNREKLEAKAKTGYDYENEKANLPFDVNLVVQFYSR